MSKGREWFPFLLPFLVFYVLFMAIPVLWSFSLSFQQGGLLGGTSYVGFQNYRTVWSDQLFRISLQNTAYYTVLVIPIIMLFSLFLAILINQMERFQNFVKACIFLPLLSSAVPLAIVWKVLFTPGREGPLNYLVGLVGIPPQNWLGNPSLVIPAIVLFEIWRGFGFWTLVFLGGLETIPQPLYEAARIDGAGVWSSFRHITVPLLKPTFLFLTVMGIIWNFQLFDAVFMLTYGGPGRTSYSIVWYIYRNAFHFENLGYAATMGILLLLIILVLTTFLRRSIESRQ
ncbi:MAG TPA: sugar ABC transporter permease [Atribacteraceae bacterium]|nr:sugar ABC transporter permease [Atribacteraceae bacterium]